MWDLAVREEDYRAVDGMLQRYSGAPLSFRVVPAYARHDTAAIDRLREEARALDARQSQIAGRYVATFLEDFGAAEELARLDLQPRRNAAIRLGAQTFLAWLEIGRGRWSSARRAFDAAEQMDGGNLVRIDRAVAATLPFLEVPRLDLEATRRNIESWQPEAESGASQIPGLTSALRPHLRLYLLALLSSRLGDNERAMRHGRELEVLPPPAHARGVVQGLAATVRADIAVRAGHAAEALTSLQAANGEVPLELVMVRPFVNVREYTQEHARYLRADALLALGRKEEARRWLETSFQGSPSELVYLAPAHFRLGRIEEDLADRAKAIAHYRSVIKLWRESDPRLQAHVKAAQAALQRLGAN